MESVFCNGPLSTRRFPFAGSRFCPWSAWSRHLIGVEKTRQGQSKRARSKSQTDSRLTSSIVPALGHRNSWFEPDRDWFTSYRSGLYGVEGSPVAPHAMQDHSKFAGKGHLCLLHAGPLGKPRSPALKRSALHRSRQDDMRCLEQDCAHTAIARL